MDASWKIQLLNDNEENLEDESVEIVDISFTIGAPINRKKGKKVQLEYVSIPKITDMSNIYTLFMPQQPEDDFMPLNCEVIVKYETNVKLNLIGPEGESLIN